MSKKITRKDKQVLAKLRPAKKRREVIQSPEFVSLYANDTQVQLSFWDMRLIFGLITTTAAEEENQVIQIKTVGEVRMSPQHAKRVAMILIQQLKRYEETIGPIPVPD
jgi:hypothetical protein